MKDKKYGTFSDVVCPYCGQVDVEKTYWVTEMPFSKYTIQCGKCKRIFKCSVNDAGEINSFIVGGKCNDKKTCIMKVNELRIGNIVQIKNKQAIEDACNLDVYVRGVSDNDMWGDTVLVQNACNGNGYEALIKNIAPIKLTEDILLKCGFSDKRGILAGYEYRKGLAYSITKHGDYFAFRVLTIFARSSVFIRRVRHLHELQNLYFAITGEELEVDLCSK